MHSRQQCACFLLHSSSQMNTATSQMKFEDASQDDGWEPLDDEDEGHQQESVNQVRGVFNDARMRVCCSLLC